MLVVLTKHRGPIIVYCCCALLASAPAIPLLAMTRGQTHQAFRKGPERRLQHSTAQGIKRSLPVWRWCVVVTLVAIFTLQGFCVSLMGLVLALFNVAFVFAR